MPTENRTSARASLRDRLLRNWPIKLTALVLSAVLWAVVTAEEPTTEIVPVMVELELPSGRALAEPLPRVQALYAGSSRELFKLYGEAPRIRKAVPDTLQGTSFVLDLAAGDLMTPHGAEVTAMEVQPRVIQVRLDDAMQRRVPVVSRITVAVDSGFVLAAQPRVSPDSVTVRGPSGLVHEIRSVSTEAALLTGLRSPIRRTIRIDTQGMGIAEVIPATVDIMAEIGEITTRLLVGIPVEIRSDRGGNWTADPPAVAVTLRGLASRLATITRDSVRATATISGATPSEAAPIAIEVSQGITAAASPDSIVVRRRN